MNEDLIESFELVKEIVKKYENKSRGGLMLGLQELGSSPYGFIGAYYPVFSNIIIMNKTPLRRIKETDNTILKPYSIHVLMHEYIHSLGFFNENTTREKTYEISKKHFGDKHIITSLAENIVKYFPYLVYPSYGYLPNINTAIELIKGFDKSNFNNYIS